MKIYYSRSNEVDDKEFGVHLDTFLKAIGRVYTDKITITQHNRKLKTYKPELVEQADIVVVGTTGNIEDNVPSIAKGCYSEIMRAIELGIPVFGLSKESYDTNYNPRGLYAQLMKTQDVVMLNEACWQIGHAHLSFYCAAGGNAPSAFLNDDEAVLDMLKETVLMDNMHCVKESKEVSPYSEIDPCNILPLESIYKTASNKVISEFLNNTKPKNNLLLVRRRMRR